MRNFLRILALLMTLIVVLLIPFSLFGRAIGTNLSSPPTILNLLAENVVGPNLIVDIISDTIREAPSRIGLANDSVLNPAFQYASEQRELYNLLLPPEIQIQYSAQLLENFFLWYNSSDPTPYLILDMRPYRNHIADSSPQIIASIINLLPACSAEESLGLAGSILSGLLSGEGTIEVMPTCIPPIVPLETIASGVVTLLRQQVRNIPETVIIDDLFEAPSASLLELKSRLHLLEGFLMWSWIPVLFLLLIAAYIGGQTLDGFLRWLGWSLLGSSISTLLFSFIPSTWWTAVVSLQIDDWPTLFERPATAFLFGLFELSKQPLLWFAFTFLVSGIILIVIGYFFRSRSQKSFAY